MLELARRARKPAFLAQALNRRAMVEIRHGNSRDGAVTAADAVKAAREARQPALEAIGLYRLAEAQFRLRLERKGGKGRRAGRKAVQGAGRCRRPGPCAVGHGGRAQRPGSCPGSRSRTGSKPWRWHGAAATSTDWATRSTCRRSTNPTSPSPLQPAAAIAGRLRRRRLRRTPGRHHAQPRPRLLQAWDCIGVPAACCSRPDAIAAAAQPEGWRAATRGSCSRWRSKRSGMPRRHAPTCEEAIALHEAQRDARRGLYRPLGEGRTALSEGHARDAVRHLSEATEALRDMDEDVARNQHADPPRAGASGCR